MEQREAETGAQQEVVAFLTQPQAYGGAADEVTRIDTHISTVFLAGDRAYKMKRAVRYDYLDYLGLERRRRFCEAEVALNRRTAPALYRGVVAVTRDADGTLHLGGAGAPVEWLVEMARFDQDSLFDRMAMAGRLTPALLNALADEVAAFHVLAKRVTDRSGAEVMRWVVSGNVEEIAERTPAIFASGSVSSLKDRTALALRDAGPLLDARSAAGRLRHCHGDLHLRNICLHDGTPTLFDGIEFNEAISVIDVLYDLAFLLMDLEHRGHRDYANLVFNRYLAMTEELDGLPALALFLSCRAAIRAHTTAAAADAQTDPAAASDLEAEARAYLDLAAAFLDRPAPRLIAIGGLSGTGKSTLAQRIAPLIGCRPGALLLRSDVTRKRLFGVAPEEALDAAAYTLEHSARVYARLQSEVAQALAAGYSVIVDAVFARADERVAIERIALDAGVSATGLWLDAPPEILRARVTGRTGDASDADAAVVRQQLSYDTGPMEWQRVDAGGGADDTFAAVMAAIKT